MATYTATDYQNLLEAFARQSDAGYTAHSKRTIPELGKSLGVRAPFLRARSREILKGDWRGFLAVCGGEYHEELMLRAMVIPRLPYPEVLDELRKFIPLIENWAVCDTLCGDFHAAKLHQADVWEFLVPYFVSDKEYEQRVAAVMLLWHFTDDDYADRALEVLCKLRHQGYYTRMAVAWAVCEFYIRQRERTQRLLKARVLSPWVQNKAIQKMRESFRVSDSDKKELFALKMD